MISPLPTARRQGERESPVGLTSLLYVSRSTIASTRAEEEVGRIVATAHAQNPVAGITGALLFAGGHFAQVLEGRKETVDRLTASIYRDPRHDRIVIVEQLNIADRRFSDWSLAYFGPSQFVSRHVTRLLGDPSQADRGRASQWLNELLHEFSSN